MSEPIEVTSSGKSSKKSGATGEEERAFYGLLRTKKNALNEKNLKKFNF